MPLVISALTLLVFLNASCTPTAKKVLANAPIATSHSYSNPSVHAYHVDLEIVPHFEDQTVQVVSTMSLRYQAPTPDFVLDVGQHVDIVRLEGITAEGETVPLEFERGLIRGSKFYPGEVDTLLGQAMIIKLPESQIKKARIETVAAKAAGMMWITPEQTEGGKLPMMFHFPEPINARNLIPCQDRPDIKATFTARVSGLPPGMIALMAAENNPKQTSDDGSYQFKMNTPLPSYLYAHLMIGDFRYQQLSERCGVYAEATQLEVAAAEYASLEQMINAGEGLFGNFIWNRQDVLIAPALAFPFSAMEVPNCFIYSSYMLTGGTQSLNFIQAHELCHAFYTNIKPNTQWSFDLAIANEGFTEWQREHILRAVFPASTWETQRYLDYLEAKEVADAQLTYRLYQDHPNPDDAFSKVSYHKGYLFWIWMEQTYGKQKILTTIRNLLARDQPSFSTMEVIEAVTGDSVDLEQNPKLRQWLLEGGFPKDFELDKPANLIALDERIDKWYGSGESTPTMSELTFQEKRYVFTAVKNSSNTQHSLTILAALADELNRANNWETSQFLLAAIKHGRIDVDMIQELLRTHSTLRLIAPVYEELAKTAKGKILAVALFHETKGLYAERSVHVISQILD